MGCSLLMLIRLSHPFIDDGAGDPQAPVPSLGIGGVEMIELNTLTFVCVILSIFFNGITIGMLIGVGLGVRGVKKRWS